MTGLPPWSTGKPSFASAWLDLEGLLEGLREAVAALWPNRPSLHLSPPDGRSTRDRQDFLRLLAVLNVFKYACARQAARAFAPSGPLTHFASPRGEKCRLKRKLPPSRYDLAVRRRAMLRSSKRCILRAPGDVRADEDLRVMRKRRGRAARVRTHGGRRGEPALIQGRQQIGAPGPPGSDQSRLRFHAGERGGVEHTAFARWPARPEP